MPHELVWICAIREDFLYFMVPGMWYDLGSRHVHRLVPSSFSSPGFGLSCKPLVASSVNGPVLLIEHDSCAGDFSRQMKNSSLAAPSRKFNHIHIMYVSVQAFA